VTFNEVLSQTIAMLQQHGRVSYRALKRQSGGLDAALGTARSGSVSRCGASLSGDVCRPAFLSQLAEIYGQAGHVDEGLRLLAEALTLVHQTQERYWEAELHRLKGELLLEQGIPDEQQAAACFLQALEVTRSQQAKSLELRAAMSLARLWQCQGKGEDARQLLAPICNWFIEGFDTADLRDAKALLDALAESQ
jgi:predicted ATPase